MNRKLGRAALGAKLALPLGPCTGLLAVADLARLVRKRSTENLFFLLGSAAKNTGDAADCQESKPSGVPGPFHFRRFWPQGISLRTLST